MGSMSPAPPPIAAPDPEEPAVNAIASPGAALRQVLDSKPTPRVVFGILSASVAALINGVLLLSPAVRNVGVWFIGYSVFYSALLVVCCVGLWGMRRLAFRVLVGAVIVNVVVQGYADTINIGPLLFQILAISLAWSDEEYFW